MGTRYSIKVVGGRWREAGVGVRFQCERVISFSLYDSIQCDFVHLTC